MKVRVISCTKTIDPEMIEEGIESVEDLIAFCARVSNPANQHNTDTADKLIAYLIKNKHWSPFEMADVTLEIETTRDIGRQILRHRSYAFQEFSQRYADPVKELNFVIRELRLQDTKNRQNSIEVNDPEWEAEWEADQLVMIELATKIYNKHTQRGMAKEVARAVLPEGLTVSKMYMKGSIRSWIHYIQVREDETTQKEHREIALACAKAISQIFPLINKTQSF